ncbi:hypothetical protein EV207_111111 [Scopulibacillus darangshiensis]|uniref:Preprotein translocase subunit Tim44 n=1 Tax=Scopulibacillus darangshiensis TaxID=442528 RepID=A0A4R2P3V6_9BACL|nr:hypothetical protein EV207_111111 [Scopulibacillus darangshiensis]
MMKKIVAALTVLTFLFTPVGNVIFHDDTTTASAKGYRSGIKSFNTNKGSNKSIFQNKSQTNKQKSNSLFQNRKTSKKGGLMKGLLYGGLAGLLFGSLLGNLGGLGSILGLMVNIFAIIAVISIIRMIFTSFRKKRRREDPTWRG